jgi:uncharacterized OB-fold protein
MENPVEGIETPIELEYRYTAGAATARFLRELKQGRIFGQRCPKCKKVIVPPRAGCARCGVPTEGNVELPDRGTVTTFCIVHIPVPGSDVKPPFVSATIRLDGADIGLMHLIGDISPEKVRPGMRVEAVWRPREEWGYSFENIKHFKPTGEPDVELEGSGSQAHA